MNVIKVVLYSTASDNYYSAITLRDKVDINSSNSVVISDISFVFG